MHQFPFATRQLLAVIMAIMLIGFTSLTSCTPEPTPEDLALRVKLDSHLKLFTISSKILKGVAAQNPLFVHLIPYINYDMTLYRIIYKTEYKGEEILASGLMSVPKDVIKPRLLSAQHGTMFSEQAAPSNLAGNLITGGTLGLELFGSAGYITMVPDFIGYGASGDIQHPYYDKDLTASATIDMILACKEALFELSIDYTDDLLLFGYSEGGFATLATMESIESNDTLDVNLVATAAGAGGYYIQGIMNHVLELEEHPEPGFLGFVVRSYNETYGWNRPYTDFFQEPYATRIEEGLLDGGFDKSEVNAQLTTVIDDYLNPNFKNGLLDGSETVFLQTMAENSMHNWNPKGSLRLYHAPLDEVLTIDNSLFTLETLQDNGASQVKFIELEGNSHAEAVFYAIEEVVLWFNSLD